MLLHAATYSHMQHCIDTTAVRFVLSHGATGGDDITEDRFERGDGGGDADFALAAAFVFGEPGLAPPSSRGLWP